MIKILFVCHGNIHRSPMAEGIFQKYILDNELDKILFCDSAGTACSNMDVLSDSRTIEIIKLHGYELTHKSRLFKSSDLLSFDYIIAMDKHNIKDIDYIKRFTKNSKAEILLMRKFDPILPDSDVPDPQINTSGFKETYEIILRSISFFCHFLEEKHKYKYRIK